MNFVFARLRKIGGICLPSAVLIAAAGSVGSKPMPARTDVVYEVGELANDDASQVPCQLNNLGDIVGRKSGPKGRHQAAIWSRARSNWRNFVVLLDSDYSSALSVNDARETAGVANTDKAIVPMFWTASGESQRIPLLPGDACGDAAGVNKPGHVAGSSAGARGSRAFLWTRNAGARALDMLPGATSSKARALNDKDEVAGNCVISAGERAVVWSPTGRAIDLGTLPGDWASRATAINNAGDVAGYSTGPGGNRAFIWTQDNGLKPLGALPGASCSRALAIGESDEVIGTASVPSGDRAFLWTRQTGMTDLNDLTSSKVDAIFVEAHAINRKGEILVMGTRMMHGQEEQECAPAPPLSFILTPVPSKNRGPSGGLTKSNR